MALRIIGKHAPATVLLAITMGALATFSTSTQALDRSPDEQKVIRTPMTTTGPNTLDPVIGSTTYDNRCSSQVYDTLLEYKYLKRPLELKPSLLTEMPRITEGGKVWHFTLKKGITFHNDACFPGGKGRELVASDVFYSWKRFADPRNNYKSWWLIDDAIVGFNDYREQQAALVNGGKPFDYDADVPGMRLINDYEFEVELVKPLQQFAWKLAMFQLSIVPREAVEMYGEGFNGHPVGTGPFLLQNESDWTRGISLTLHRNPDYRDDYYPDEWMPSDKEMGFTEAAGTKLPIVDRLEFRFYVESQPMWLQFKDGKLDFTTVPEAGFFEAFSRRTKELRRSWKRKGIVSHKVPLLDFIFRGFNMEDEFLGGFSDRARNIRHAITLAQDLDELNEARYNGTALVYDGPIPPGLDGHPENGAAANAYRGPNYDAARQKLRDAGYEIDDKGKVIDFPVIEFYTSRGAESEKIVALLERNLDEVGIKLNARYVDFPTLMDVVDNKKAPMFSFAWGSDYPDAENNLSLFYGPNESPGSNHYNYKNPVYDKMYEKIQTMPPGAERTEMYIKMRDMIIEDAPYTGSMARVRSYLVQPWLKNFKPTEDFYSYFKYMDVDMEHKDRKP